MKNKQTNIIYILLFICFWSITLISIVINKNEDNNVENRKSYHLKKFTITSFIKNDYQNNLEKAIADQMPKYNYFQLLYPKIKNNINFYSSKLLAKSNKYIDLGPINYYKDYLLYDSINQEDLNIYNEYINKINTITDKTNSNIYTYYINGDTNINFENNSRVDIDKLMSTNLKSKYSSLSIDSFNDYKKYYYKTDHHLNNHGTNKVYSDLISLLKLDNSLSINKEKCFKKNFIGSKEKTIALNNNIKEKICVFDYNYPSFNITIDNKEVNEYGNNIEALNNMNELSYALIYGGDYKEILFINNESNNNKKLLIFSNSYSNSLNKLLASNYQETYVIDARYFENFDLINYVNEKNIDDVLILANKMLFYDKVSWGDF